jgi:hypothetical protein
MMRQKTCPEVLQNAYALVEILRRAAPPAVPAAPSLKRAPCDGQLRSLFFQNFVPANAPPTWSPFFVSV